MPIVPASNFNPNALTADDLYIAVQNPPGFISGVPTDVFGLVGTASWGPVNTPVHMGSPFDALQAFGPISAASLTDPYDIATDLAIAFGQATGANNESWGIRVTDDTDVAASGSIDGVATSASATVTIGGSVNNGDSIALTITKSGMTGTPLTLTIPVVSADTLTTIAAKIAAAVNANGNLAAVGLYATSTGAVASIYQPAAPASQATFARAVNGTATCTATVGGTPASTDTVALTFTNVGHGSFPITKTFTVGGSDTTTTIAAGLVALITGDASLAAAGVTASNTGAVITISETSLVANATVVSRTIGGGGGATETVTFNPSNGHLTGGPNATATLSTGAAASGGVILSGLFTGSLANGSAGLQAVVTAGAAANTWSVQLAFPTLNIQELYPNLPTSGFWPALVAAINTGISGVRGPSAIATAELDNLSVGAPTPGTYLCSGGTDGRSGVVTADLVGSDTAVPKSGLYALQGVNPAVGVVWLCGCTDTAVAATLVTFGATQGCTALLAMPTGTSTAQALASVSSVGAHNPAFAWTKDWVYFYDPVNAVTRLVSPNGFIGGYIATLPPSQSPSNKQVQLVVGTERNNPQTGNIPYTESEVGQLESAGVLFITNPIPAGAVFGIRHGQTTSLQSVTAPVEYWRMTSWLARSFAGSLGGFVGQLQSAQTNDPLRNAIKVQLNAFLNSLRGSNGQVGQIDDFTVVCTFSAAQTAVPGNGVNTPTSIAQHYVYVLVRVRYLSSVRFFILTLQGGTTVVTVGAGPGQSAPGN